MQDPDPKCRHFCILWHFMTFYGILAFLPKSLIRNQIRLFRFLPIFRLFPTFRLFFKTLTFRFTDLFSTLSFLYVILMEQVFKWCVNIPCTLELSISQWIMVFGFHFVAFSAQSPNGPQCDVCGQLTRK